MEQLIKTLPKIVEAAGDSPEVIEAAAVVAWKHVAGELLSKQTVAMSLSNKTLVVAVPDAVWKKQLESMSSQLVFRLKSILGRGLVSRIEFRVDSRLLVQRPAETERGQSQAQEPAPNDVSLEVWAAANAITDKQLRKSFLKAATASLRRTE
jgi:hypothetical protein